MRWAGLFTHSASDTSFTVIQTCNALPVDVEHRQGLERAHCHTHLAADTILFPHIRFWPIGFLNSWGLIPFRVSYCPIRASSGTYTALDATTRVYAMSFFLFARGCACRAGSGTCLAPFTLLRYDHISHVTAPFVQCFNLLSEKRSRLAEKAEYLNLTSKRGVVSRCADTYTGFRLDTQERGKKKLHN